MTVYVRRVEGRIVEVCGAPQPGQQFSAIDDSNEEVQALINPKRTLGLADYAAAVQAHVDAVAMSREFHDGVTAATYLTSTIPRWKADAEAFVAWRDQVWAYSYGELDKVKNGQRLQPTINAFINELPAISWPDE
ncbi:hypothetical protein Rleg2_4155 [Rhizobium leguminosarum bv. trifolii WSM2304]|uniref:Uncharacterized protein n=1 Tax=Rhizobium leguminosarum bv. trifolii (strain WSM2304) TaxID=395492 RepID=A0ABF7QTB8_RHILW|nr:hypothetical protein [Rhizobium leguminosarum]ACI57417.1 hypothetical protein Rleg2_4155 [Rhizobium leguminosarum bv. trifolii WSM2304]